MLRDCQRQEIESPSPFAARVLVRATHTHRPEMTTDYSSAAAMHLLVRAHHNRLT
jgi:hypothetical protein